MRVVILGLGGRKLGYLWDENGVVHADKTVDYLLDWPLKDKGRTLSPRDGEKFLKALPKQYDNRMIQAKIVKEKTSAEV